MSLNRALQASFEPARSKSLTARRACPTAGYDPSSALRAEGASRYLVSKHVRTLPSHMGENAVHVTTNGAVELLTFCRHGRLYSMVQGNR